MKHIAALGLSVFAAIARAEEKIPCIDEQGFGIKFGQPVRSSPVHISRERQGYPGGPVELTISTEKSPWPPFSQLGAILTIKSKVPWASDGSRRYETEDEAKEAFKAILDTYSRQSDIPWRKEKLYEQGIGMPEYQMPMEKVILLVRLSGHEVYVRCEHYEAAHKALLESLGR